MDTGSINLDLLIKLLKLTTSSHDNEALLAIRKANEQLARASWDWDKLLRGKITVVADPFTTIRKPTEPMKEAVRPTAPQPAAPPKSQPYRSIVNHFGGHCYCCGVFVDSNRGFAFQHSSIGLKWNVACIPCEARLSVGMTPPARATRKRPLSRDQLDQLLS